MILGSINSSREAVIKLRIISTNGLEQEVEFSVDTGFNDYMTLTPDLITALDLSYEAPTLAMLADGSILQLQYYRASILWNGNRRSVPVLQTNGGPLIGMSMLYGCRLIIDAVDGGDVVIEYR